MTKTAFIEAYKRELITQYPWASDQAKMTRFMEGVRDTLAGVSTRWNHVGEASNAAWRAIGQSGKPSLVKLRALAD